jgi:hypothetical protein
MLPTERRELRGLCSRRWESNVSHHSAAASRGGGQKQQSDLTVSSRGISRAKLERVVRMGATDWQVIGPLAQGSDLQRYE